jgi:hypothetical protein
MENALGYFEVLLILKGTKSWKRDHIFEESLFLNRDGLRKNLSDSVVDW